MDNARGAWDLSRVVRPFSTMMLGLVILLGILVARDAFADDPRALAETLFQAAEKDDEAFRFAEALEGYDAVRRTDPGSRFSPRAEARAATLRAHAEGGFGPFTRLERVRRDPKLAADVAAIDALVADADAFPPGPTRVEVWVLAAEAYTNRFARPAEAMRLLERVIADEKTDPVVAKKAVRDLTNLQLTRGDLAGAERTAKAAGAKADAKLVKELVRMERRRFVHHASIAAVLAMLGLAALALVSARRRGRGAATLEATKKTARLAVLYGAYVAISGAVLASGYESGTGTPFLVLGLAIVPIVLVARAWGAAAGGGALARASRASLCAAGALGAAFLVLEHVNASFLDGMGL